MTEVAKLTEAIGNLDAEMIQEEVQEVILNGEDANRTRRAIEEGREIVHAKYSEGKYFDGDLLYAETLIKKAQAAIANL